TSGQDTADRRAYDVGLDARRRRAPGVRMRVLHSLKTRVAARFASVGALVAAGSVALYGAYGKINRSAEPVFTPGAAIQTGQWHVVPRRAWVSASRTYDVPLKPGATALVLE